jgi:hypothetical protein
LAVLDKPTTPSLDIGVRRFEVAQTKTGWMVRGRARFRIPQGQDLSTTGLALALTDADGGSLFTTRVEGSDLVRTRTGWRLARVRPDLKRLQVDVSGESARVEIRTTIDAIPPRTSAEKTQSDGAYVYWEMRFGAACGGTGGANCTGTTTSRKCRVL